MLFNIKCVKQMLAVINQLQKFWELTMEYFSDAELRELLIPSICNNNTKMKKICLALSFCFCRQSNQINMLGLMPEMHSS